MQQITPVILTYNESENIHRTLSKLHWAEEVVVVDSGSQDDTCDIARRFSNVRLLRRKFDCHANQWNYAVHDTEISTEWVLALDADYVLTTQLIDELVGMDLGSHIDGYEAPFIYCIDGKPINGSLYPPVAVLYRKAKARYVQDGHTQRVQIQGEVGQLHGKILHDDRKPHRQWVGAQRKYADLEAKLLENKPMGALSAADKVRKLIFIAPVLVPLYVLFVNGAILNGGKGLKYAYQRFLAECLLSYRLLKRLCSSGR